MSFYRRVVLSVADLKGISVVVILKIQAEHEVCVKRHLFTSWFLLVAYPSFFKRITSALLPEI